MGSAKTFANQWLLVSTLAVVMMTYPALAAEQSGDDVSKEVPAIGPSGKSEPLAMKDCMAVDFASAELLRVGDRVVLKVKGEAPHAGMTIEVRPVMYVMQPDYWQMGLVACVPKGATAEGSPVPFTAEIVFGASIGRKGVELSGKPGSKPVRVDLKE